MANPRNLADIAPAVIGNNGNIGIGATPSSWGSTYKFLQVAQTAGFGGNTANNRAYMSSNSYWDGTNYKRITASQATQFEQSDGGFYWLQAGSSTAGSSFTFTQAMTLESSGTLRVNNTSNTGFVTDGAKFYIRNSGECMSLYNDTGSGWIQRMNATSNGGTFYFISFASAGTGVGAITASSTTTTYATSSDYRLKENIAPMTGALATVAQLKPCTYTWKLNGSSGQGFIAHELAEVLPEAVVGEKDAVETYFDDNNNEQTRPVYQGIDTSFLVATLTAAIQEQQAIIESLKARLDAANL